MNQRKKVKLFPESFSNNKTLKSLSSEEENAWRQTFIFVCCSKGRPDNALLNLFCKELSLLSEKLVEEVYGQALRVRLVFIVEPSEANAYFEVCARRFEEHGLAEKKMIDAEIWIVTLPKDNQGLLYTRWHSVFFATTVNAKGTFITDDDITSFAFRKYPQAKASLNIPKGRQLFSVILFNELFLAPKNCVQFAETTHLGKVFKQSTLSLFEKKYQIATLQPTFKSRCVFDSEKPWQLFLYFLCQGYFFNSFIFNDLSLAPKTVASIFFPPTAPKFGEDVYASVNVYKRLGLVCLHTNFFYFSSAKVGANPAGGGLQDEYKKHKNSTERMFFMLSKIDRTFVEPLAENCFKGKPNIISFKMKPALSRAKQNNIEHMLLEINKTINQWPSNTVNGLEVLSDLILN